MSDRTDTAVRIVALEAGLRRARLTARLAILGLVGSWLVAAAAGPEVNEVVRTKVLIIEDEEGRDRIVLGAPMPDERQVVGMKILGPGGAEQFGLSLKENGSIGMGFDVMPGVGNPGNRERLNMGVTSTGHGWIRYLDNETRARMYLHVDNDEQPVLRFLDWTEDADTIVERIIGSDGEQVLVRER